MIVNSSVLGDPIVAPNTLLMVTINVSFPSGLSSFVTNSVPEAVVTPLPKNTLPDRAKKSPVEVFVIYRNIYKETSYIANIASYIIIATGSYDYYYIHNSGTSH